MVEKFKGRLSKEKQAKDECCNVTKKSTTTLSKKIKQNLSPKELQERIISTESKIHSFLSKKYHNIMIGNAPKNLNLTSNLAAFLLLSGDISRGNLSSFEKSGSKIKQLQVFQNIEKKLDNINAEDLEKAIVDLRLTVNP